MNNLHIVQYAWRAPLSFFFTHFLEFRTVTRVLTSLRSHLLTKESFTEREFYDCADTKLGVILISGSIASPFWFNLSTRNRLFYFWFLPFSGILRMGYSALVYCNMFFFQGAKPRSFRSFCHFGHTIPQCNNAIKTLWFSCLMRFPHSFQAFMHFWSILGLLRIEPEFFQFTSIAFQKVSTPNQDFHFFGEVFFLNFVRREKSCISVTFLRFFGRLNMSVNSHYISSSLYSLPCHERLCQFHSIVVVVIGIWYTSTALRYKPRFYSNMVDCWPVTQAAQVWSAALVIRIFSPVTSGLGGLIGLVAWYWVITQAKICERILKWRGNT